MKPYYQDSAVMIYHGNCLEMLSITSLHVGLVIVDPPYNVALGSKPHALRQTGYTSWGDSLEPDDYKEFVKEIYDLCWPKISKVMMATPGNSNQTLWPKPLWSMAWVKTNGVTRTALTRGQKMNHACWEPILVYGKLFQPPHSDVINIPISMQSECEGHPCPKPLRLFPRLICATDASVILDPFMGSGTTLRAAKDLGRQAIGIEIEERYCEIAAKRMAQEVLALA